MAVTPIKALLFLAGGCVAAGTIAYVSGALDPLLTRPPAEVAAPPEQPGQADSKDARLPAAEPPAAAAPEKPAEAPPTVAPEKTAEPAVLAPSFDIVRVEGDGSIVIAGKATPNSKVELLIGSNVIGAATTGPDGDFAAVLEEPLKPGNYQIVLRSTAPDNVVAMSVETAVVSVPETKDGQVLALVEEPGKPSEIITVPEPEAPATAAQPPAEPPAAAAPPAEPKPGEQVEAAVPPEPEPEPAPAKTPPAPAAAGPHVVVQAVEIDGRKIFVAGAADPGRTVRGYANEILLGDAKASPDGRYLIEAERDLPVGDYIIRVDALEPDGVKVAARAAVPFEREPGESIAAVAPTPEAIAPPAPEAVAPPAVAQAPVTETPTAPVTPPAVAEAPAAETPPAAATPTAPEAPAATAEAPAKVPAVEAPAAVAEAPAAPAAPETDPGKAASSAPATTDAPAPETPAAVAETPAAPAAPGTDAATDEAPAVKTPPAVAETPAAETPAMAEAPAAPETPAPGANAPAAETSPDVAEAPAADTTPAPDGDVAMAPAEGDAMAAPPPAGVPEVVSPKLQNVGSAVIIRRGDTLWRISRRVYGRGVRYSTIYLANQTQIEDPDRIWPGQVFKVPEKSDDGEDADMSQLGDRQTSTPE